MAPRLAVSAPSLRIYEKCKLSASPPPPEPETWGWGLTVCFNSRLQVTLKLIKLRATAMPGGRTAGSLCPSEWGGMRQWSVARSFFQWLWHRHYITAPPPPRWIFGTQSPYSGALPCQEATCLGSRGLSAHAPGCFLVITSFTCLPACQNLGLSQTPGFSDPEGRARMAFITTTCAD